MINMIEQENTNITDRTEIVDILTLHQKWLLGVPYFFIEPAALVLNFLTLLILRKLEQQSRRLHRNALQINVRPQLRTFYFLRHLVYSDLLTCLVAIPFDALEIYHLEFRRSGKYCAVSKYVRFVALSTSFYILVVTCFERFWTLTCPLRPLGRNTVVYMTRAAWLVALLINIPSVFFYESLIEVMEGDDRFFVRVCVAEKGLMGTFTRAFLGVTFLVPAISIAILTVIMLTRLLRWSAVNAAGQDVENAASDLSEDMRSIVRLSVSVVVGFWLCSSPAGFYYLIIAGIGTPEFPLSYLVGRSITIVANASAAVNPIVTIVFFPPIKEMARQYLGLSTSGSYNVHGVVNRATAGHNDVRLVGVRERSSMRKIRLGLKPVSVKPAEEKEKDGPRSKTPDQNSHVTSHHEETAVTLDIKQNEINP